MEPWEEVLEEMRGPFMRNSTEKFAGALESISMLEKNAADAAALTSLRRYFHWFAGASGVFGFDEVTEIAFKADEECGRMMDVSIVPTSEHIACWKEQLQKMRQILASGGVPLA